VQDELAFKAKVYYFMHV